MNSFFILFLVICDINGQVIHHNKDYAMLEQEIMQNIRRPVLELVNAFLGETKKQIDQVEEKCSERIQALNNRILQNEKTSSEGIQALNKTLTTSNQREDERDANFSTLAREHQDQAAEIDYLRRGLASLNLQLPKSCPDFHMDETTLPSYRYLSEDRKTLFNTRCSADEERQGTACSYDWPAGSYTKYRGTRGSLLINPPDQVYFEVNVTYSIIKDLTGRNLVFEVGIAREEIIDLHIYVGINQYGWSVNAVRDDTTGQVKINCDNNNKILYSDTLSKSTSGTSKTLTLGIYVNAEDSEMSVVDVDRDVLMYTFTDIDFTQPLRPVFAVYNPKKVHVVMELKTGTCISGLPKCLQK